ncbi:MAG TPA: hypothetical protein VKZ78_07410 [Sphingobacteriaceae bacterium]|nr:hypothetical protein [Sphingobacteriaceae bacterium]
MKYTLITLILSATTNFQLIINEILFNPQKDGVDFVEIFNPSGHPINLQEVWIANINNAGAVANMQRISETPHIMMPGTYRVLTTDPLVVAQHYPKARLQHFIKMNRLPAFNNNQGNVLLLHQPGLAMGIQDLYILDSLFYSAAMHSPFIKDPKGISLERQNPSIDTNAPGNFKSAAVSEGGATPGYQNSSVHTAKTILNMKSRIVSPDHDGIDDQLELHYNITHAGLMATIQIFNSQGYLAKNIIRNTSIPSQGIWVWDGQNEQGSIVSPGIYTIVIELYNNSGYRQVFRKSFVIVLRN